MKKTFIIIGLLCLTQLIFAQEAVPAGKGENATRTPKTQQEDPETGSLMADPAKVKANQDRDRDEALRQREEAAARTGSAVNPSMAEQQRYLNMPRTEIAQLPISEQAEAMRALGREAMILNKESIVRAQDLLITLKSQLEAELAGTAKNPERIAQLEQRAQSIANLISSLEREQEKLMRLIIAN